MPKKNTSRKTGDPVEVKLLLLKAGYVFFHEVCEDLGITGAQARRDAYRACWRRSQRGAAGALRRRIYAHLYKRIRAEHATAKLEAALS